MDSLKIKFIFWYSIILAITFSLFSVVLYVNLHKSLNKTMEDILLSKADGIADSIYTYWETEKLDSEKNDVSIADLTKTNNLNFSKIAKNWVKEKLNASELTNIMVWIYDDKGNIIAATKDFKEINILPKEVSDYVSKGNSCYFNINLEINKEINHHYRALTIPVLEDKNILYFVQVASPLTILNAALSKLKFILFLLLPLTVLLTSFLAGKFLASITLKPLNAMVETAQKISAENLKLRINIPETQKEIKLLADTFNDMIDKLDNSFMSQKHFIQDISHELRTPLTILKGELEVTLKRVRSQEEYLSILKSNLEEINKISRLVDNLLLLARFENQEIPLEKDVIDISVIAKDIISDVKILAFQKFIEIKEDIQEQINISGDQEKLKRVLLNLLDNAIKYTPEKGFISLEIYKKNNNANIKIIDTGLGISNQDLPFIFDRFYKADKSRSSAGYGLGLSIVKSIIEAHKGVITVESDLGKGTTFLVSIPFIH